MRKLHRTLLTLSATGTVLLALAGCGSSATAVPTATAVPLPAAQQPQGTGAPADVQAGGPGQMRGSGVSQLALGTFYLEDTEYAVTAEQAATLLPLWQEMQTQATAASSTQDEMTATTDEIRAAMTEEQLAAIDGLDLSSEEMQAVMSELGVAMPTGMPEGGQPAGGQPQGTPGAQGQAPQGTPGADGQMPQGTPGAGGEQPGGGQPGGGMIDSALLEQLITLLQERAQGG